MLNCNRHRTAGAKLLVVLLLMAALPAWTLGQSKPGAAPEKKNVETKPVEIKEFRIEALDGVKIESEPSPIDAMTAKVLEAKIADLKKKLEALKAVGKGKAAGKKPDGDGIQLNFDEKMLKELFKDLQIQIQQPKKAEKRPEPTPAKPNDYDAKIAELLKQIEALKAAKVKEAAGKNNPRPMRIEFGGGDGILLWTVDPKTGKAESKSADPKTMPRLKIKPAQPAPGQPLEFEFKVVGEPSKEPKYKVIGPDGKEIKGAKVIVVEEKPVPAPKAKPEGKSIELRFDGLKLNAPDIKALSKPIEFKLEGLKFGAPDIKAPGKPIEIQFENAPLNPPALKTRPPATSGVINLSRATYSLPKEKTAAVAAFLKENVKAAVLELKIENDGLTVTTTPEVQSSIAGLIKLVR
jgi:hypothetical protein